MWKLDRVLMVAGAVVVLGMLVAAGVRGVMTWWM